MKKKSIIEIEISKEDLDVMRARADWELIRNQKESDKLNMCIDTRNRERYCQIIGGIVYPGIYYGCYVVAGIKSGPPVQICIMEYYESENVVDLIVEAARVQLQYGCHGSEEVLQAWIGDPDQYELLVAATAVRMEQKYEVSYGFYVREPYDFERPDRFSIWARALNLAIRDRQLKVKGSCFSGEVALKGRLNELQHGIDFSKKEIQEQFPAVRAIGMLVYTASMERIWTQSKEVSTFITKDF